MQQPKQQPFAPRLSLKRLTSRCQNLRILLQQASKHSSLTDLLNASVPELFKNQFQVNAIEQNTLILTCHSAALMTRFRFKQQDVINQFNQKIRPKHITNIKIKIRPKQRSPNPNKASQTTSTQTTSTQTTLRTLSKKNAQILHEEAEHTDDIKLKNILLRLAKHSD